MPETSNVVSSKVITALAVVSSVTMRLGCRKMVSLPSRSGRFPTWIRWGALCWLLIWIPAYWHTWGLANFLHLCDIAVVLTCIGLSSNSALLLSSQAVSSLLIDTAWAADAMARFLSGRHLIGGTEYLFDTSFPLWVRMLSLFHIGMPFLLLGALKRVGYDRRGWILQCAIAIPVVVLARLAATPKTNINFVYSDPFFHRIWGPAPLHILAVLVFLAFFVYLPTHLLLCRFPPAPDGETRG